MGFHPRAGRTATLLLAALLAWCTVNFARAAEREHEQWRRRDVRRPPVLLWRFGVAPVARLERCTALVAAHAPADAAVVVLAEHAPLQVQLWAAYLLPTHRVIGGKDWLGAADWVVTFGRLPPPPGTPVAGGPLCRLHRLR